MLTESPEPEDALAAPHVVRRRWMPSLIWLVPLTALVIGASLIVNAWRSAGPRVTLVFETAEGLEVGKTLVKYRNVTIGHVTAISLSPDRNQVRVTAELSRSAEDLLTDDARFWVVRPRIGIGGASGLETLISGAYLAVEPGSAKHRRAEFVGLENPPPLLHGLLGKSVVLHAEDMGSLALGAPVYFRRFEVGRVIDRGLESDGSGARIVLFVDAPYDRFLTRATRFWNSSGIDVAFGVDGLKVKTQSLAAVLAGGVAFETLPTADDFAAVPAGAEFTLFKDESSAMAPPEGEPHFVRMRFAQSLRGLAVGAPVEFVGVSIGRVFSIDLDYDAEHHSFPVIVTALIYPRRLGKAYDALEQRATSANEDQMARLVGELVARGLRAQPRPSSLLTGQLYIALDFIPGARPAQFSLNTRPLDIPTVPGGVQELQQRLTSIIDKLDRVPINELGQHLDEDLVSTRATLDVLRTDFLPAGTEAVRAAHRTLGKVDATLADDAPWRDSAEQTLVEARRTLRSARSLAEYLDRHPEALIAGRHPTHKDRAGAAPKETE